jgi:ubiquinone/menaquinone biosynthesis C-methylase UbiE
MIKNNLTESDINKSLNHPHRNELIKELDNFPGITKILEIGSSWGPNLFLINQRNPFISCFGIDISKHMIDVGNEYIRNNSMNNIHLICGDMASLNNYTENEFDLIISDAALIYIDNKKISAYAKEMVRITRLGLILIEFDDDSNDPCGKVMQATWIRDYGALFKKYASKIIKRSINEKIWPGKWAVNGKIITVFLN